MKIRDIMTAQVETLPPEANIVEAAQKMDEFDIGAVPVVEGNKVVGLVTDRDITIQVIAKGLDPTQILLRDIMSSPVIYAQEDMDIEAAAGIMMDNQVRRLVILDKHKKLVGIASLADIALKSDPVLAEDTLEGVSAPAQSVA